MSYLEMPKHKKKVEIFEINCQARSLQFNSDEHKSLNIELKHLYTAITRAKSNLWIYDSHQSARQPMLEYWHKRDLIKLATADSPTEDYNQIFASDSTPEQWKVQGDRYRDKCLWKPAIMCYERAGQENEYLVKETEAFYLHQEYKDTKNHNLLLKAVLNLFESDNLKHSIPCIRMAAVYLTYMKPPMYLQAAKLFERLGDLDKAVKYYAKAKDFSNFARIQESRGKYESVIQSLIGKPFMKKLEAVEKSSEYAKKGYYLAPKFTPDILSISCARFYSESRDKQKMLRVLKYIPDIDKQTKFMKEANLFEEAYDCYISHQQSGCAYQLALACGWFDRAIELANREDYMTHFALFALLKAKYVYSNLPNDFKENAVDQEIIFNLKKATTCKNKLFEAEAHLLLGMLQKKQGPCRTAQGKYQILQHKVGILEAFEQVSLLGEVSDQDSLNCCHIAKKVANTLHKAKDISVFVNQAESFYGLQRIENMYLT